MGIYTDLAAGGVSIGATAPGLDKSSRQQLLAQAHRYDPPVSSAYAAADAVVTIATHTGSVTDGTYTLSFSIPTLGVTFTTAALNHDDTAATIEAAIDTASPASVGDGDLVVAEENSAGLQDGFITITAEDTVASMPVFVTIDGSSLVGGGAGAVTQGTYGQADRKAAMALWSLGAITGTLHNSGEAVNTLTVGAPLSRTKPRRGLIIDLARVAAVEDGSDAIILAVEALYPVSQQ